MHRVYVEDGTVWTLANTYVQRAPIPSDPDRLVVYETVNPPYAEEVCMVIEDGRRLCDFGPGHRHGGQVAEGISDVRETQLRSVMG